MEKVSIRPGVNILSVLSHLNYKPWYALGEFVDNSLQSAISNWNRLQSIHGQAYKLRVVIEYDKSDNGRIIVRDNAMGIASADYKRAFRTAEVPPDRTGLSEFGIGMKAAGFWFSSDWSVRTKAFGEKRSGLVHFDLDKIMKEGLEELPIVPGEAQLGDHYTEIDLLCRERIPFRTMGKIKEHLAGIYREFIRKEKMELLWGDEPLHYKNQHILVAPDARTPDGPAKEWKQSIHIELPGFKTVKGFVALRGVKGSTTESGLALFRRDRLIMGSGDDTYRPHEIFGAPTDPRYQRVFGELHLEGFPVSHTKDGFQWGVLEEVFLAKLKEQMDREPIPLSKQARGHSYPQSPDKLKRMATATANSTIAALSTAAPTIEAQRHTAPSFVPPPNSLPSASETAAKREIKLNFKDQDWTITIDLANDPAIGDWLGISEQSDGTRHRELDIRVNLAHPFMQRFGATTDDQMEALVRIAACIAIAEKIAREQGGRQAGTMRRVINELLRTSMSAIVVND
jgi:hypothetical protein